MKKLLMLLPLLLVGCMHTNAPHSNSNVVSIATGTNGKVDYSCSQLDFPDQHKAILFRCEFHNTTNQRQPGPAVRLTLFSEKTGDMVGASSTIYASPTESGQTDKKYIFLKRASVSPVCGYNLEHCVVLVEKDAR